MTTEANAVALDDAIQRLDEAEVAFDALFAACARNSKAMSGREVADLQLAALRVNQAMLVFIQARARVGRQ